MSAQPATGRVYRLAFVPALVVLAVVSFSLQSPPPPLGSDLATSDFDSTSAASTARKIVHRAPVRMPGSAGDAATTEFVARELKGIQGADVTEERYASGGSELRNVVAVLPGASERRIVLLAPRDSARGTGAASSPAATAAMLEIVGAYDATRHRKTLVFVSTDGSDQGASGAREFAARYPDRDLIDAAIVLSQPAAADPHPPYVIPWSSGRAETSLQLVRTAEAAVDDQTGDRTRPPGLLASLTRLALPTGLGEQAPLVDAGLDSVAISSAGERPLPPSDSGGGSANGLSQRTLGEFGRATLNVVQTLDETTKPLVHGPSTYLLAGGRVVPGWAPVLLALVLLLPSALVAGAALGRAWRRGEAGPRTLAWGLGRAFPFIGVLLLAYLLALVGIASSPDFPYDPGAYADGWRAVLTLALLAGALGAALRFARPLRLPRSISTEALAPAVGSLSCLAVLGVWLENPYLALLLVPIAHVWLLTTIPGRERRFRVTLAGTGIALLPALIAVISLGSRLGVGPAIPWHLVLMLNGGQIGLAVALFACVLAGTIVASLAIARAPERPDGGPRFAVPGPSSEPAVEPEPNSDLEGVDVPTISASTEIRRERPRAD